MSGLCIFGSSKNSYILYTKPSTSEIILFKQDKSSTSFPVNVHNFDDRIENVKSFKRLEYRAKNKFGFEAERL